MAAITGLVIIKNVASTKVDYWWIIVIVVVIIFLLIVLLKVYVRLTTGKYEGNERLYGKTVVITGANSGIGLETAKELALRGARLIMVCRDMQKAEVVKYHIITETNNPNIILKYIDFALLDSVRRCAYEILAEESRIDILINNAGAVSVEFGPTRDGLETLMQVNYFGPFLFTNILLGKIKESAPSRIINVSSIMYKFGKIDLNHFKITNRRSQLLLYCDTKLATIYFSNELADKLRGTGVTSNSLHPGLISTDIVRNSNFIYKLFWKSFIKYFYKTKSEGAQTSLYLSLSPEVENVSGQYFSDCKIQNISKGRDKDLAKKIWTLSEEAVKLKDNDLHY